SRGCTTCGYRGTRSRAIPAKLQWEGERRARGLLFLRTIRRARERPSPTSRRNWRLAARTRFACMPRPVVIRSWLIFVTEEEPPGTLPDRRYTPGVWRSLTLSQANCLPLTLH